MSDIVSTIKQILLEDPEVKEKWEDFRKIESFQDFLKSFSLGYFLIKKVVYVVELLQSRFGAMEKEQRIEYAANVIDDLIQFKGWARIFEPFDGLVFKLLISAAVNYLDDFYGRGSWPQTSKRAAERFDVNKYHLNSAKKIFVNTK